jgi:hypothetical protein
MVNADLADMFRGRMEPSKGVIGDLSKAVVRFLLTNNNRRTYPLQSSKFRLSTGGFTNLLDVFERCTDKGQPFEA